jgi:hypothetical protein
MMNLARDDEGERILTAPSEWTRGCARSPLVSRGRLAFGSAVVFAAAALGLMACASGAPFHCYTDGSMGPLGRCVHAHDYCVELRTKAGANQNRNISSCAEQSSAYCTTREGVTQCSPTSEGCEAARAEHFGGTECTSVSEAIELPESGTGWSCGADEPADNCFRSPEDCASHSTVCVERATATCTSTGVDAIFCVATKERCERIRDTMRSLHPTKCVAYY